MPSAQRWLQKQALLALRLIFIRIFYTVAGFPKGNWTDELSSPAFYVASASQGPSSTFSYFISLIFKLLTQVFTNIRK